MREKKKKNNKPLLKKLKQSTRIRLIITLGLLLAVNTFAWFVYSNTISAQITARVKSWKIAFETEEEVIQYVQFDIGDLYPGMEEYLSEIKVLNYGETTASITYEFEELRILDEIYNKDDYSSEELLNILNDNPFAVNFGLDNSVLEPQIGETRFTISVTWPYENNDDEADTAWGHAAYQYKEENPDKKLIEITMLLTAIQVASD